MIKGLDTDYEYRMPFRVHQWSKLVGFMQLKSMKQPDEPKQLLDKVIKHFMKSLSRAEQRGTNQIPFNAATVLRSKKQAEASRQNSYPLMNSEEKINDQISKLAVESIIEPSMASQKLTNLRNNPIAAETITSRDDTESPDK